MKLKDISQLFAITTNLVGWIFVITAGALFETYGFILGGAFFMMFGMCLVMVSFIWLMMEYKMEKKKK